MSDTRNTSQGVLEMHPKGYGFLRNPSRHYAPTPNDAYVPAPMIVSLLGFRAPTTKSMPVRSSPARTSTDCAWLEVTFPMGAAKANTQPERFVSE